MPWNLFHALMPWNISIALLPWNISLALMPWNISLALMPWNICIQRINAMEYILHINVNHTRFLAITLFFRKNTVSSKMTILHEVFICTWIFFFAVVIDIYICMHLSGFLDCCIA